ncbi:MAG TPA: LLM class F420-dependent oxidoreductase [Acidimicrobiales bacterium]|nr:LLM class F420-dependent oxidoreductase [Acidimicrobiales bacterium]
MRMGIITPVVTLNPRAHGTWEEDAGLTELTAIAEAADRLGYHHLTCSEHVAVPVEAAARRGSRYWDPLATFGYLAARTTQIRLATHVLVLGYHHPLEVAKRYGTLDVVSGGRLVLGVGVGSLEEEFDLLGAPFPDRGERGDDALRALRASLGRREPSYHGSHHAYEGFVVDPPATRTDVPLWIGGRSYRSLRRAVELADGWAPFGVPADQLGEWLDRARSTEAWTDREHPLEVVLYPDPVVDPAGDEARTTEMVERYVAAGATVLNLRFKTRSLAHCLEQLEAMAQREEFTPTGR